jgi:hypothetical protein
VSRRKVVPFPRDDAGRLRGLLAMLERHAAEHSPVVFSKEAMERAGFVIDKPEPPPDRFLGRRILAWIEEREARRKARRR